MNLLYFSTAILPSEYANSVHVMKMCSALANCGHSVTLVGIEGHATSDIYSFYNVKNNFEISLMRNDKYRVMSRLKTMLKRPAQYDVIYTRYAMAAYIYSAFFHKPVIFEYHAKASRKIYAWMESRLAKSKRVRHVFITDALKNEYFALNSNLANSDYIVLPDAADDPNVEAKCKYDEKLKCGYIGSFQEGKGVEVVCQVAELLPNIEFHIVGGKESEINRLRMKFPNENITWHGFLSQKDAMEVLNKDIDIALLPNQKNVFVGKGGKINIGSCTSPMKLFEYMSYKKAIISSKIPVLMEIVQDRENALLVEPDDVKEWKAAIEMLCNDAELYQTICDNAYQDFCENYTWDKRAEKVMDKLDKIR